MFLAYQQSLGLDDYLSLARQYDPILLYSGLESLSIVPALILLGWVLSTQLTTGAWHLGWALLGIVLLLVPALPSL